jgi:hypothetical protein
VQLKSYNGGMTCTYEKRFRYSRIREAQPTEKVEPEQISQLMADIYQAVL